LERDALPPHIRTVNLPGIKVTVQEMIDALVKFGGEEKLKLLKEERYVIVISFRCCQSNAVGW
jgi:hypothetical protein